MLDAITQRIILEDLKKLAGSYNPQIQWSGTLAVRDHISAADHTNIHGFKYAIDIGDCTTEWISPEIERLGESGCLVAPEGTRFYEFWRPVNYRCIEFHDEED